MYKFEARCPKCGATGHGEGSFESLQKGPYLDVCAICGTDLEITKEEL